MTNFWSKVRIGKNCWEWLASRDKDGYGKFGRGRAHRVSYELHFGPIPAAAMVLHTCDNPWCVNPGHLYLGNGFDNARDKVDRGRYTSPAIHSPERHCRGSRSHLAKLNEWGACGVLARLLQGAAPSRVAREFDIHKCAVGDIKFGRSWKALFRGEAYA
jgi:hypothetical protein